MLYDPNSLANIAKDTIARKNPFPPIEGLPHSMYGCKWGLTDLYPEDEQILRSAIDNRQTFDTGWIGCKKEIRSFRMISDGKAITIMACAEMDEFEDLIYDAMDKEVELTEEQTEELWEYWYESDMNTSTVTEHTVPVTTYEDAMSILDKLDDSAVKILDDWFEVVKEWVAYILDN